MSERNNLKSTSNIQLFVVIAMIGMCLVHCRFFMAFYKPYDQLPFQMPRDSVHYLSLLGLISMCFPIAAGEFLRVRLSEPIRFKQWKTIPNFMPLKILIVLAMMDSVKNFFSVGFYNLIRWDILPFIVVSICIVIQTLRWGKSVVYVPIVAMVIHLFVELLTPWIQDLVISTPARVSEFVGSPKSSWAMLISLVLVIAILHYLLSVINRRIQLVVFCVIAFVFAFFHINYWSTIPTYGASIYNFPLLALKSTAAVGGHIWPLIPWIWLVVFGFLARHFIEENSDQKLKVRIRYGMDVVFVLYFMFYFGTLYPDYYAKFDTRYLFSSRIFAARAVDILGLMSLYWILRRMCEVLLSRIHFPQLLLRLVSSGAVVFYVVHYLIAYWTVHTWAVLIRDPLISYWLYAAFVAFVSVGISSLLVALYQGKVLFFIKKV